jgi:DNA segregation ATPase FtsK/SpoIIIE, S-DNA-T family
MVATTRMDERRAALRFCIAAVGWLACLFAWASVLSFNVADPPATAAWPPPAKLHNWCGPVGAAISFYAFTWLGIGTYPLLVLVNVAVVVVTKPNRLYALWQRILGLVLICAAFATFGTMVITPTEKHLLTGPGGILGTAAYGLLVPRFGVFGTTVAAITALLVGFVLAADNLIAAVFKWLLWAGGTSAPVLARGGAVVAGASVAAASGVLQKIAAGSSSQNNNGKAAPAAPVRPQLVQRGEAGRIKPKVTAAREMRETKDEAEDAMDARPPAVQSRFVPAPPEPEPPAPADVDEEDRETEAAERPAKTDVPFNKPSAPVAVSAPPPRKAPPPPPPRETGDYKLPVLELLDKPIPIDKGAMESLCREKAYILEQTLNEFRLAVEVVAIETGPVITVFELKLAPGIKVSQIVSLSNDMARALKAPAVRVVAPLPGKNTIGIEVPNIDKEKVRLREVMEMATARTDSYAIPLYLGKDASGQPLFADLTRMPHLLIAGTTGSGKSVCVTSIIMSILMTRTPDEVSVILVDPKVVELAAYKDVPHLICPIVTEVAKAEGILDWASTKMDERYALLAEAGVKDIRSYNRLGKDTLRERLQITSDEEMAHIPVKLPYIVIMIDELADLMMLSPKEVEFHLCRIAQKSRAVGIHLIVSTQRPQANVVTGLIKSNLPSRIAFRVSSRLDSRIVLDQNGGEVLMGQGDMLFLPPGSSKLVRAQGTFVDDDELRRVVRHSREQREPQYHPELVRIPSGGGGESGDTERDELFDQAVDIIIESGRGSVSLLQRRLTVGYGRASRLIDQMYAAGIVGEYKGSQAREVVVTKEEWHAIRRQRDTEEAAETADLPAPD